MKNHSRIFAVAAAALLLSTPAFAQGQNTSAGHDHAGHSAAPEAAKDQLVTDPVCGMKIDPKTAAGKSVYKGQTYYFCSADEKVKFDKEPEKYVKKQDNKQE